MNCARSDYDPECRPEASKAQGSHLGPNPKPNVQDFQAAGVPECLNQLDGFPLLALQTRV